jgi:2-polyprenyl-6-methoxyphenol hydroxylase-like FAD-dependent oxidoreductase
MAGLDQDALQPATDVDVLIVGAGPTGLMAAALLARCGVKLRILDKSETAVHESRAFGVHAKSLELFLNIGLADAIMDKGRLATGVQLFVDGRQAAELNLDDIGNAHTPFPFVLMLPQAEIEAILIKNLHRYGVRVERSMEVLGFEQTPDKVVLQAKDKAGETQHINASYLIGADGAHSITRHILGLNFNGAPYPQGFLLADCKIDWPFDYDHIKIFLHERSMAVFMPLHGRETSRIIVMDTVETNMSAPIERQGSSELSLSEVQQAFRAASGLNVTLSDPVWTSRYRVHHRSVDDYRKGRVFVAGDAAHIHSPAGGQGMNTGLQDAANLAWKLALAVKAHASDTLLDTYQTERWPVGQNVLKTTDRLFSNMTVQSAFLVKLRNGLVPYLFALLSKSRFARAKAFHFISQLAIRYEPNSFMSGQPGETLSVGARAPDAVIAQHLSVFDLIEDYRFHLLALSRKPLNESAIDAFIYQLKSLPDIGLPMETHLIAHSLIGRDARLYRAESADVFEAYGVTGPVSEALFLIRPDGYIAYQSSAFNIGALKEFLSTRFGQVA